MRRRRRNKSSENKRTESRDVSELAVAHRSQDFRDTKLPLVPRFDEESQKCFNLQRSQSLSVCDRTIPATKLVPSEWLSLVLTVLRDLPKIEGGKKQLIR